MLWAGVPPDKFPTMTITQEVRRRQPGLVRSAGPGGHRCREVVRGGASGVRTHYPLCGDYRQTRSHLGKHHHSTSQSITENPHVCGCSVGFLWVDTTAVVSVRIGPGRRAQRAGSRCTGALMLLRQRCPGSDGEGVPAVVFDPDRHSGDVISRRSRESGAIASIDWGHGMARLGSAWVQHTPIGRPRRPKHVEPEHPH